MPRVHTVWVGVSHGWTMVVQRGGSCQWQLFQLSSTFQDTGIVCVLCDLETESHRAGGMAAFRTKLFGKTISHEINENASSRGGSSNNHVLVCSEVAGRGSSIPIVDIVGYLKECGSSAPAGCLKRAKGFERWRPVRSRRAEWQDDPAQRHAIVYFTSGTTGRPKAVLSAHTGYVNALIARCDYMEYLPGLDVEAGTSSLAWDVAMYETYSAWACGCTAVRLTEEQIKSGPGLVRVLQEEKVTSLVSVPGLMPSMTSTPQEDLPLLRQLTLGGESVPKEVVDVWTKGGYRRVFNNYGPTEASIEITITPLLGGKEVTIGAPKHDASVWILDHLSLETVPREPSLPKTVCDPVNRVLTHMAHVPRGKVGEICLGGPQLALGYMNRPDATADKFIYHPELGRLYRTGDLGLLHTWKNEIHFRGRIDHQVKIRGHRIELEGVEAAIRRVVAVLAEKAANEAEKLEPQQALLSAATNVAAHKEGNLLVVFLETTTSEEDPSHPGNKGKNSEFHSAAEGNPQKKPCAILADRCILATLNTQLGNFLGCNAHPNQLLICAKLPTVAASGKLDRVKLDGLYVKAVTHYEKEKNQKPGAQLNSCTLLEAENTEQNENGTSSGASQQMTSLQSFVLGFCRHALNESALQLDDDFILDVGVDSLRISRLVVLMREKMQAGSNNKFPITRAVQVVDVLTTARSPRALAEQHFSTNIKDGPEDGLTNSGALEYLGEAGTGVERVESGGTSTSISDDDEAGAEAARPKMPLRLSPAVFTVVQLWITASLLVPTAYALVLVPRLLLFDRATGNWLFVDEVQSVRAGGVPTLTIIGTLAKLAAQVALRFQLIKVIIDMFVIFEYIIAKNTYFFVFSLTEWLFGSGKWGGHFLDKKMTPPESNDKRSAEARCFPKWGLRHLYVWQLDQMDMVFSFFAAATWAPPWILSWLLRLFGAKVGSKVCYAGGTLAKSGIMGDLSLLTVGDGVIMDDTAQITTYHPDDSPDRFFEAPVVLQNYSKTSPMSVVVPGAILEERACLAPNAALAFFQTVERGQIVAGVPARDTGQSRLVFPDYVGVDKTDKHSRVNGVVFYLVRAFSWTGGKYESFFEHVFLFL